MWNDFKFSVRMLRQTPAFSALAVFVLALGIGVNTAIFSLVNAVLLRPPNVRAPSELRYVYANSGGTMIGYPDYRALRDQNDVFSDVAATTESEARLGAGADVRVVNGEAVSANYFEVLGVTPRWGRAFAASLDEAPDAERAVVISYRLWTREYGADPNVIGTKMALTRRGIPAEDQWPIYTIVGVAPEGFTGVCSPWAPSEYWVPLVQRVADYRSNRGPTGMGALRVARPDEAALHIALGRLKPGVADAKASATISALGEQIRRANHPTWKQGSLTAHDSRRVRLPFDPRGQIVPERLAAGLLIVAGLVLIIAVTNLAGMLIARGMTRRTEMAVRLTLGASRWQVTRRLLAEGGLLSLAGGVGGLGFARLLIVVFMDQSPSGFGQFQTVPFALEVSIDGVTLAFTALLCVGVGVLVSLAPARQASRTDLLTSLAGGAAFASPRRARLGLRHMVLIPQVCLSTALLLTAGVLAKPLLEAERVNPGYAPDDLAFVDFGFPRMSRGEETTSAGYQKERDQYRLFNQRVLERLAGTAGVTAAALTTGMPESPMKGWIIARDAYPKGQHWWVAGATVSDDFFKTVGIRLRRGRGFDIRDQADGPKVAIIDETLATWLWPGQNPIGRYVAEHWPESNFPPAWLEVVGVVNEVQPPITSGLSNPYIYRPLAQGSEYSRTIVARGAMPAGDLVRALRQAALDANPVVEMTRSGSVRESIAAILYPRRMAAGILAAAGLIGLILSAAGLYGVISYSVAQRLRELGIRATLGADPISLMGLVLREGGRVAVAGIALGLVVAYSGIRVASKLVTEIPKLDQVTIVVVPLLLGIVALLACFVPARRASKVDPIVVLRTN
jgi:putative ABC transport system permease protein